MPFDFEALVGHLYIVGGRSISAPPPGALVEVAPKKAARGRETDTFFTLVLPSGDVTAPTAFYEQMAQLAAERYFSSSGSVTAGLRAVFNTLNENLVKHNASGKRSYEANMLCVVLRDADLIVARVGAGVALLRHKGDLQTFPTNLTDDDALFSPPLGVQPVPDVRMTRYQVGNGTRLILADHNLADMHLEKMNGALLAKDISEVLVALKELVKLQVTLMGVEFVPPDVPLSVTVQAAQSTLELTAAGKAAAAKVNTQTMTAVLDAPPEEAKRNRRREATAEFQQKVQRQAKQSVGTAALRVAEGLDGANRLIDKVFPAPDETARRWLPGPWLAGAVVLIPLAIVVLVVVLWVGNTGTSEFEICVQEVNNRATLARSIDSGDVKRTLDAWGLTLSKVADCNALRPGDVLLEQTRREGQTVIDGLNQIDRREAVVIASLPKAALKRIVLQGQDLYVLDGANAQVYRVSLSSDGKSASGTWQAIPGLRRTAVVGQYTVGDLVDIVYSDVDSRIVGLDRTGLVIECSSRFTQTCEAQRLIGVENWGNPIAIQVWQGRLYILDAGKNQIWRYEASGGAFATSPGEYFTGQGRPTITNAVDFGIDENGNIYLLLGDGTITKFRQGQAQNFGYMGFPEWEPMTTANALFLNNSPISPGLYVVSRTNRTIYETSLAGTWSKTYKVSNDDLFASVADVVANPSQQMVYAVSGNAILAFEEGP